ncbi:MAG: beta-phosphoglucomutase [Candidatus Didemnitutus sp.]|nr:beta-phosphoglucomutase [Candidatus Didemnitutus sp.]
MSAPADSFALSPIAAPLRRNNHRAALFDLDGVLVDTAAFHYRAWRRLAQELGFDFPESANEALKGVSRQESLEILLRHGGRTASTAEKAAMADRKNRWYQELLGELVPARALPGARACLIELRRRGVKIALGSASRNAAFVLERLGIAHLFDAIIDGTRVSASKPDPEVFLLGARALGVAPADCVVFEDAAAGIVAAKRAGMLAVGIGHAATLDGADIVVPGLAHFSMNDLFPSAPAIAAPKIDFAAKPFHLTPEDIDWVRSAHAAMSVEEKLGQLFCLVVREDETEASLDRTFELLKPGGFMLRPRKGAVAQRLHRHLQTRSSIPLLLAANLEQGGVGIADDGTRFSAPLGVAATDDEKHAYRLGLVSGREGRAVGCNWAFAPVADIDFNCQNPITNIRTFGSDPARVSRMVQTFLRGLHEEGLAASVKHWPGDGVDARDQHLHSTVNNLSVEEWERTYGEVYRAAIDAGAATIMAAHIALPAYSRHFAPDLTDAQILPSTLSPELIRHLLRGQLGFNGLIVTDATNMVGMTTAMPRRRAVPTAIEIGCDMFLFTVDLQEDLAFMREGLRDGLLSETRLDEAVLRILALKASLGLHRQQRNGTLVPAPEALSVLRCAEHERWARECADRAVTLVKDTQHLLPLSPERHRRVLIHVLGDKGGYLDNGGGNAARFVELLRAAGFVVEVFDPTAPANATLKSSAAMRADHDLVVYFASLKTASNQTVVRLNWGLRLAFDAPRYVTEVPTLFVSIDNPYHLQDVPQVKTFINGYTSNGYVIEAVVEKLLGHSRFTGVSPVDPFCGYWDAKL